MLSQKIEAYLKDHETAWSYTTLKSERARLASARAQLDHGPERLYEWARSQSMKPYSIRTLFVRVCGLEAWVGTSTSYRSWFRKHKNTFKHVYTRNEVGIPRVEAIKRIEQLDEHTRETALSLLTTGLRISEMQRAKEGSVVGKGGKRRKVYGTIKASVPVWELRAKLKTVGLKPHDLRKLCATELALRGATAADLCQIMGWSSITTAFRYLEPREEHKLRALVEEDTKES